MEQLERVVYRGVGYSSHSHFTANFRKAFGLSPSQARARLRSPGRR